MREGSLQCIKVITFREGENTIVHLGRTSGFFDLFPRCVEFAISEERDTFQYTARGSLMGGAPDVVSDAAIE
jgi:hypothetical protein